MSKSLIQRWREGELSRSSTASTVVLAFCLAATLLSAYALVLDRSGRPIAQENGSEIIQQVSQMGLEKYLGREPQVMYYLLEEDNQPNGYRAFHMRRDVKGYQGQEILFYPSHGHGKRSLFNVSNDLAEYDYTKVIQGDQKGFSVVKHAYRNGELFDGHRRTPIPWFQPNENNFVPVFLLDFFSSLSAKDFPKKGAAFSYALLEPIRYNRPPFEECWVQSGGEIPSQIKADHPNGRVVTVDWNPDDPSSDPPSHGLLSQTIYYNMNHQLIWQKSITATSELIQRAITLEKLDLVYPGSKLKLEEWLGDIQSDEEKQII